MTVLAIGVMSQERIRERVLAIARGEYKPRPGDPKIWFPSMKSLADVLSDDNRKLLREIAELKPESVTALAEATGRIHSDLSRTLEALANLGIIELRREHQCVRPIAKATEFRIMAA